MLKSNRLFRFLFGRETYASATDYFANLPTLQTPRLTLRKLRFRDAADIYDYARDPAVAEHVLWDAHTSMMDSRLYIQYMLSLYRDGKPSSYGIVLKATDHVIGTIGFMTWNEEDSCCEVGYSLSKEYWGKGLATEALHALLTLSFRDMKLHRIEAMHEVANPASGRVMAKNGMSHEGTLRKRVFNKGEFRDVELYAILKEDWESRKEENESALHPS